MHFVVWDFLKMFTAAVLCGVAVSLAAAGIAMVLASSAEARAGLTHTSEPEQDLPDLPVASPTPGELYVGGGCGGDIVSALERDWRVSIRGNRIEVRVMQTFQVPADAAGSAATFQVQLLKGARLQSLAAQTSRQDWPGQLISAERYEQLTPAAYLQKTRKQLLVTHSAEGNGGVAISTSPIMNLQADELLTLQYTYVIAADLADGFSHLLLPLEGRDEYSAGMMPTRADAALPSSQRPVTHGTVWVEWLGNLPASVRGYPKDADMEIANARIEGLSWAAHQLQPGDRFQLAWAM